MHGWILDIICRGYCFMFSRRLHCLQTYKGTVDNSSHSPSAKAVFGWSDILPHVAGHQIFNWPLKLYFFYFFKAAIKITPQVRSFFFKWDLSLVWRHYYPFTTIASASRVFVKEPYCLVFQVILRPVPAFYPKSQLYFTWIGSLPF